MLFSAVVATLRLRGDRISVTRVIKSTAINRYGQIAGVRRRCRRRACRRWSEPRRPVALYSTNARFSSSPRHSTRHRGDRLTCRHPQASLALSSARFLGRSSHVVTRVYFPAHSLHTSSEQASPQFARACVRCWTISLSMTTCDVRSDRPDRAKQITRTRLRIPSMLPCRTDESYL